MTIYREQQFINDWRFCCQATDGCSFPPGFDWLGKGLCDICKDHDFDYEYGWKYGVSRKEADEYLYEGVKSAKGKMLAWIMWCAVRVFGHHYFTNFRSYRREEDAPKKR